MDLRGTYNRIAEDWHRDSLSDDWWREGTDAFIKMLSPGASILDVGCGDGIMSKYFAHHRLKVTGIDISDKMLEIAKRESPEGEFKVLSMVDLDTLSEKFDAVFAQASLLHIPKKDVGDVVKKMADRLVLGGFVSVVVKEIREDKPEEGIQTDMDLGYAYERFFSYFTMAELESYFTKAGLEVKAKMRNPTPPSKTVWLQIIGKK